MASFEPSDVGRPDCEKFPIRRLEPAIKKFVKILQIDLDRLNKHKNNIEKFQVLADWSSLNKEQINATRTVQQLKANIKELEKTRNQIKEEDLLKFDSKTEEIKQASISGVVEFLDLYGALVNPVNPLEDVSVVLQSQSMMETSLSSSTTGQPGEVPVQNGCSNSLPSSPTRQMQMQLPGNNAETREAAESWENLKDGLVELNTMVHEFSTLVHDQQETVDRIEDHIDTSYDNVHKGTIDLGKAAKYKAAILPVAGALLGGVLGGPIGLFAGAKLGGLAGVVGGGILGFGSGKFMKTRQDKVTEVELQNLSKKGSRSLPELNINDLEEKEKEK